MIYECTSTAFIPLTPSSMVHDYPFEEGWTWITNFTRSYVTCLQFLFPCSVIYCNTLATFSLFFLPTEPRHPKPFLNHIYPSITSQTWIITRFRFSWIIIIGHLFPLCLSELNVFAVSFWLQKGARESFVGTFKLSPFGAFYSISGASTPLECFIWPGETDAFSAGVHAK